MVKSSLNEKKYPGPEPLVGRVLTPFEAIFDQRWLRAFVRHLWQQFRADRSFEAAGALSYTSLLALVPLMAVMFGVISAFPVFERWANDVEDYIFTNFVPAAGDVVREYLLDFVGNTAGLTSAGTVFLIITAIFLMATIEKSLNRIWRVRSNRRPANRLVIYWAALTLGPLLMGASLALTSYLAALHALAPEMVRGALQGLILHATPFFVALVGFALLFIIVPNRRVRWHHALMGALLSAILFEMAKRGFVYFVSNFPTYELLYGALATVPLFLVWIFVSWVVVLLGASVAAALTTFNYRKADWRWSERHELLLALRLLGHFWLAQRRGKSLAVTDLLNHEPASTDSQLRRILGYFHDARFIHRDDDGDWLLSTDLGEISFAELYSAGPFIMPVGELSQLPVESHWDRALIEGLKPIDQRAASIMHRSIKSLLQVRCDCHRQRGTSMIRSLSLLLLMASLSVSAEVDFDLPGLDNQNHRLSDYRGGWVVVNYWATWCAPCRKEIPDLSQLHDSRTDLTVLGLAFEDTDVEDFERFLEQYPATYPILLVDVYNPPESLGAPRALPTTYLFNAAGDMVNTWIGPVTSAMIIDWIEANG
jgi:membrane protein